MEPSCSNPKYVHNLHKPHTDMAAHKHPCFLHNRAACECDAIYITRQSTHLDSQTVHRLLNRDSHEIPQVCESLCTKALSSSSFHPLTFEGVAEELVQQGFREEVETATMWKHDARCVNLRNSGTLLLLGPDL